MTCPCGETSEHVIAKRKTFDGIAVEIWHDGAITGRFGRGLPGVPISRPRSEAGLALSRAAADLFAGEVEIHTLDELPRLYSCARKVAKMGGLPGDLRTAFHAEDKTPIFLAWEVYATDRDGVPTCRVARLDRIRWPGLVIWHERGRYEVLTMQAGISLGSRSRDALHDTGIAFTSQRDLFKFLIEEWPQPLA